MPSSYDVFDDPVKQSLESYIQQTGHKPALLEPIIYAAIEQAKNTLPASSEDVNPRILRSRLESSAKGYINAVLSQNKEWRACREYIKAYSSVFLAGAGLSYDSNMPLSNILGTILKFCDASDWQELRDNPKKCLSFKQQFKKICDRKSPSASHKLIIRHFPEYILEIICLNWDDLFEKAARSEGRSVNKQNVDEPVSTEHNLWKFHGDVENIKADNVSGKGGWVFPDEPGYVFDSFKQYIQRHSFRDDLFTFVIVGYKEREKNIYENMVAILETSQRRPTFRIGLNLKNLRKEGHIIGPAEFTITKILPNK